MNFIETYKKGKEGKSRGLPMGQGLSEISKAINGVQKSMIYGLAGGPKSGKSTLTDYGFLIEPYLYSIENNIDFEVIYNSYEIDRVSKEFDCACFFLYKDFGIKSIKLEKGILKNGSDTIELSSAYLRGRLLDDNNHPIVVKESVEKALKVVYQNRIIPLFGEYSIEGTLINPGKVIFLENRDNPTGIRNFLIKYAENNGTFHKIKSQNGDKVFERITGYTPKNPAKIVLVITDHLRKLILERGFTLKQTIDKYIEYSVELRNWCGFSFLHIIHLNRNMTDITRLKYAGDLLFPNGDDIKDSGNLPEEVDYMFTLFNPNDERYALDKHFGVKIKDSHGNENYPNMRTAHLVESRHCDSPQHFRLNMFGNLKIFEKLEIK